MTEPFTGAVDILRVRLEWTRAVLARELSTGRQQGYFTGPPLETADPEALARAIFERVASSHDLPSMRVRSAFDLGDLEENVVWLLACVELDPGLCRLLQAISLDGATGLSLQLLGRLTGAGMRTIERLGSLALVELPGSSHLGIHHRIVRISDRILELLRGHVGTDPSLARIAELTSVPTAKFDPPASLIAAAGASADLLVVAVGPNGTDRELVLCAATPGFVLVVTCSRLSSVLDQRVVQVRACVREAALFDATILFAGAEDVLLQQEIVSVLCSIRGPILATVSALVDVSSLERPTVVHHVLPTDAPTRRKLWRNALPDASAEVQACAAERYRLPSRVIAEVARDALATTVEGRLEVSTIQEAVRARFDRQLAGFARRVSWEQTWDDLVLPQDQVELLVELLARIRYRERVLVDWGFAAKVGKGHGVCALFSGPPGTGKTMIGGLIAKDLGLDLYQVDLSKIVSKYIGETEKQLASLFDAAESGHAVILFDEADSLFGKRTEVRSSNDRYANLETNYLLQRIESFDGICILTTNHENAIDEAFMRRLAIHVRVPMPDEDLREKLWQRMIPASAQTRGELDFADLAREFTMSGGYIKNAVLRAAYLAAVDETGISQHHFERAARAEYEAMGKVSVHRHRRAVG